MKKLIIFIVVIGVLALIVAGCGLLTAPPSEESELDTKKPSDCVTIKDGILLDSNLDPIVLGYDVYGYNYQAHIFSGRYCDNDRVIGGDYCDVDLMMKWNDAWLSNKNCDEDDLLDRHYGYDSYIGSGAWLTNHQWGSYKKDDCWTFVGDWVLELTFDEVPYAHDVTFTTEVPCLSFSGTGGYPSGEAYTITSVVSGAVNVDQVLITITYTSGNIGSERYLAGTIAADGTMSGEWTSNVAPEHSGTWKSTMGTALCYWDYFVKIVAAPSNAYVAGGVWYTTDGIEIGPVIWGSFAIIQQVENDLCAGISGLQYSSPCGPGLGKWEY